MVIKKAALVCLFAFLSLAAGTEILLYGQEEGVETGTSEGSYHFVVLPDTQYYYADQGPGNFGKWLAQMNWIRDNAESHDLRYVLHLGDITDQSDHSTTHLNQWNSARTVANGIMDKVPLALAVGNHDGLSNSRTSLFSNPEYFGAGSVYANQPTLIELMNPERWENSVHRLEVEGQSWLILAVEWGPRDDVVAWANDVLSRFPDDYVILILHAFLFRDSSRFDWELLGKQNRNYRQRGNPIGYSALDGDPEGVNDGQKLWNKLIRRHHNVKLVLNGHVSRSGHGRRVSIGDDRHFVHQHLNNFQHWTGDGNGRMRLMEINPAGDTIKVTSFSPFSGETLHGPDLDFTFSLSSRPLKAHYRQALWELQPVAAFRLQGEDPRRPLISKIPSWQSAQAEGFKNDDLSWFGSGRRVHYRSSTSVGDAWTALLWFRSDASGETLPLVRVGADSGEVLSVFADTDRFTRLLLDASHSRSEFDAAPGRMIVRTEPSHWHHLAVSFNTGKLTVVLDGESIAQIPFFLDGPSRFSLGDFGNDSVAANTEWRIVDFSVHDVALTYSEIEWLWRSAFCQTVVAEIDFIGVVGPIPSARILESSYPGFALRAEIGGEYLFGAPEPSFYRILDSPGASRDLHSRYFRLPRTLEYSDGVLLITPFVSDSNAPAGPRPPVQWQVENRIERQYIRSTYAGTQMSVLNLPLPFPYDDSIKQLNATFFPFANDWKGGYISESGEYLYGQEDVIAEVVLTRLGEGRFVLTPPSAWNPLTLLGQTALRNTRLTVQPDGDSWELSIHEEDPQPRDGRVPFAFVLLPHEAEGVRSGWFDPAGSAGESSLWERLNTGSYQFSEPSGSRSGGVLQITPGATPEGDAPLMKLYSSENADWEVNFEVDGETVDIPFSWAWISSVTAPPAKATASDDRVLEALKDSAYMDFGWYFSERLGWIHVGSQYWPWVWSARSGWLFLFLETAPSDGLWFFASGSNAFVYLNRQFPLWAYSTKDGWIPWNRETE